MADTFRRPERTSVKARASVLFRDLRKYPRAPRRRPRRSRPPPCPPASWAPRRVGRGYLEGDVGDHVVPETSVARARRRAGAHAHVDPLDLAKGGVIQRGDLRFPVGLGHDDVGRPAVGFRPASPDRSPWGCSISTSQVPARSVFRTQPALVWPPDSAPGTRRDPCAMISAILFSKPSCRSFEYGMLSGSLHTLSSVRSAARRCPRRSAMPGENSGDPAHPYLSPFGSPPG